MKVIVVPDPLASLGCLQTTRITVNFHVSLKYFVLINLSVVIPIAHQALRSFVISTALPQLGQETEKEQSQYFQHLYLAFPIIL